eukprot:TRINITY_DN2667_c0_g1_i2.p1 TRINITY_DN2667_c0_g1~~TRINITY_DN2667_c0_g1_i2.p1  ORF type:complete len:638 (+),score=118.93 TRINITY_DN2667_c0_g1_i2:48-1961(+)
MTHQILILLLYVTTLSLHFVGAAIYPRKCCSENEVFDLGLRNCSRVFETKEEAFYNALVLTVSDSDFNIEHREDFNFSEINYIRRHACPDIQRYVNSEDEENSGDIEWLLFTEDDVAVLTEDLRDIEKDFCVDRGFSGGRYHGSVLVHCFSWEKTCLESLCIPTLCSEGLVYNSSLSGCSVPNLRHEDTLSGLKLISSTGDPVNSSRIVLRVNTLKCPYHHLYSDQEENYFIDENGALHIANGVFEHAKYSIYREETYDENSGSYGYITRIQTCTEKIGHKGFISYGRYVWTMFLVVCQFLSMIFLLLLIAYLIKTNRRKLFGILTLCMTTSLFFFYLFLATTQVLPGAVIKSLPRLCLFLGYGVQFSYQTSIFWLNTMCIDIWCTFRYIRRSSEIEPPGWKKPIFKLYCLYAWGVPALISIITITMNSLPKDLFSNSNVITPGIGDTVCFFSTDLAKLLYFHLINFIVIIANVLFFTGSSWNLLCGVWADGGEDPLIRKQNRLRHKAVFKLFFAMGISWLAEVVSWIFGWTIGHSTAVIYGSAFFDMVNALQGVTIFVVIVFDSANITKIKAFLRKHGKSLSSDQSYNVSSGASMTSFGGSKRKMARKETPPTRQEVLEMKKEEYHKPVETSQGAC